MNFKNLLCKYGWHDWEKRRLTTGRLYFYDRACRRCQLKQIQHNGPMGDGKWHLLGKFRTPWEKEWYESARIVDSKG